MKDIPPEKVIQAQILEYLAADRRVAWAERFNSGTIWMRGSGKTRPFRANTLEGCPDILGQMNDGRFLAIEVKRPGWKCPSDEREVAQSIFLEKVRRYHGVADFCCSVDDTERLLKMSC